MGCGSSREEGQEATYERSEPLLDFNCKSFEYGGVQVAQVSVQGWRKTMEDVSLVQFGVSPREDTLALGVFDGHSGAAAAQYAQEKVLGHIKETEEWRRGDVGKGCIHGFMDVDVAMRKAGVQSGTTAVLALLNPDEIVVANCGDSRSVLSRGGRQLPMSVDHKPGRKAEKRRIIRSGGYLDETDPKNPRVVCDSLNMSIATSRALGDFEFKSNPSRQPEEQMISPVPELYTRERTPEDEFLILASDGVWDVMDNPGIVSFLQMKADALDQSAGGGGVSNGEEAKQAADAEVLGRAVLQRCLELGSRDNMTIVLADLRQRWRRKANPTQQHPPQPPGPPTRSSSLPSMSASAGDGSVGVGVDVGVGVGVGAGDGSRRDTTSAASTQSPTVAAAAAAVGGEAVSVSAVKLEGGLDRNGGVFGADRDSDELAAGTADASCSAEPWGQKGDAEGGSSGPTSVDARNQGSVAATAVGTAGLDVAAVAGEKVAVEPPEPPGELAVRTQAQAHVPPSGGAIVGGIGDSGGSSSSAGRAGAAAAAAGGDAVVGEALLKEERPGLLRLPESVDGDDGVVGVSGRIAITGV